MANQKVDNNLLPAYVVETEVQPTGEHRQVVKIGSSSPATASSIGVGNKTIASTGVAVPLVAVSTPRVKVFLITEQTNTGKIYWGGSSVSSTDGAYLFPATALPPIEIDDVSKIYINGTAGDGVKFTYLVQNETDF